MTWQYFIGQIDENGVSDLSKLKALATQNREIYQVYPQSLHVLDQTVLFIAQDKGKRKLVVYGQGGLEERFEGITEKGFDQTKVCDLSHSNAVALRKVFPFTAPVPLKDFPITIGLGDRLGIASPGHLQLLKHFPDVRPVLAQQSMRELNLTGRNYQDVLDAATWAVFQEDYQLGFGADGDHLKTAAEIKIALECGFTMITLDCSEHIDNQIQSLSESEITAKYQQIPADVRAAYEKTYLNTSFYLTNDFLIQFDRIELMRVVLIYHEAIRHTVQIWQQVICKANYPVDFEISIDETLTSTSLQAHFLVANELVSRGVTIASLAPRFCGEFQKGIDYRGDTAQFKREFTGHTAIANFFKYKISVHSGSDKFSVFPIIGAATAGKFHLKTAGTNWLEALRVVAEHDPALFREIYVFALHNLNEARKYYHIGADPQRVPPLEGLRDDELPGLLSQDDARQILHITYGLILQAPAPNGAPGGLFRERLFKLWSDHEDRYEFYLGRHIGRHLEKLGLVPQ